MKKLGIIGFGTFSRFITPFLTPHFNVKVWNRTSHQNEAQALGVTWSTVEDVILQDIIIIATNIRHFEPFLKQYGPYFNPNALVMDVASVKMVPAKLMLQHLPPSCEIIATHPLFGPQSGAQGIANLKMVLCNVRSKQIDCVRSFLEEKYHLKVYIKSPEEHDKQMAYVQALTHYVARAVNMLHLPPGDMDTLAYLHLMKTAELLGKDSLDLFTSIQTFNPFASEIRKQLLENLSILEKTIEQN